MIRDERGLATLEATLAVVILVPLLFAILQFGGMWQRWLAQDGVALQAARLAGEVGGDTPQLRAYVDEQLRLVNIDPGHVTLSVAPSSVGWREPVRVTLAGEERIAIPFLFAATVPVRSTAVSRGEVNR